MSSNKFIRPDLLDPGLATPVIWLLAFLLIAVWYFAHVLKHRLTTKPLQWGLLAGRVIIGMLALWALYQGLARFLVLESSWTLRLNAFIGALAIEFAVAIYQFEKRLLPVKLGKLVLALRIAAVAAVLTILVQPVFAREVNRTVDRKVVVLIDDSGSMQVSDMQMSVADKIQLAGFYGIDASKNRPNVGAAFAAFGTSLTKLDKAINDLNIPDGFGTEAEAALLERSKPALTATLKELPVAVEEVRKVLKQQTKLPNDAQNLVNDINRQLVEGFGARIKDATKRLEAGKVWETQTQLKLARDIAQKVMDRADSLKATVDEIFYQSVSADTRAKIDELANKSRAALARDTMERTRNDADDKSLMALLQEKFGTTLIRFGKASAETPDFEFPAQSKDDGFRMRTDLNGALTKIAEQYPAENLAGVLLLSDCRHNTEKSTEDIARKLGIQGSPIVPVVIGSSKGSKDVSIVSVSAPEAIYESDKVRAKVDIKADGLLGKTVKIQLLQDGTQVATQDVPIPDENYRTSVRLAYQPKAAGTFTHTIKIEPVEGETFKNNNEWVFKTAVSDDRTNVLIIEDRPRWEFRYLRNLFDSRDKSVHLQYILLHPDELPGAKNPDKSASAAAKFGDSEATKLPEKLDDWKKFDVIILGDIPPASLDDAVWKTIQQCVNDRGAMLAMIAGPTAMPHAYTSPVFKELCPVLYQQTTEAMRTPPEPAYRIMLTGEGRSHIILKQSDSGFENTRIWDSMPVLRWRHAITNVKEGVSVLAYAKPVEVDAAGDAIPEAETNDLLDPAFLSRQKASEKKNALIVVNQVGNGKVAMLNFDHTWRLRYGVGDTYHHKLWGQMLRWGAGDNLRAGNEYARLGTDKLTYEPGEPIKILGKLIQKDYTPIKDSELRVRILKGKDEVSSRELTFQPDSPGIYEGMLESIVEPGDYTIELQGDKISELAPDGVKTSFTIANATNPIEMGDISIDQDHASKLANFSRGVVVTPTTAVQSLEKFGPPSKENIELVSTKLWDSWFILLAILALLTAEWLARRKGALI